jgi:hypothetical protein
MLEGNNDDRIQVILHDFKGYDNALKERLRDAQGVVWALGISQTAVSKEEYIHITKTMTLEAAKVFEQLKSDEPDNFRFVFVSGEGATPEPGRFTPIFGRVKGETEIALMEMEAKNPKFQAMIVRPAYVDPKDHQVIHPWIPQLSLARRWGDSVLGPLARGLWKGMHSPTGPLGEFLAGLPVGAFDGKLKGEGVEMHGSSVLVNNVGFRRIMGLN